ncbi:MAG: isocitrate/isopropylmalate family dehydrogenase [Elainellaceae cyanobacterium]
MTQKHYRIVALPGEDADLQLIDASLTILRAIAAAEDFTVAVEYGTIGAAAQAQLGTALPEKSLQLCEGADGAVIGPVGEDVMQGLCRHFGLVMDLCSMRLSPTLLKASPLKLDQAQAVDLLILRELVSTVSAPDSGRGVDGKGTYGFQTLRFDDADIRQIAKLSLALAETRQRHLTIVHKENILPYIPWTRLIRAEAEAFSAVTVESMLVDDLATELVVRPQDFDVILTCNLFGGILSNLAEAIVGSSELLGSTSLNIDRFGLYDVVSRATDSVEQRIAALLGTLSSLNIMLEQWGERPAAQRLASAQERFLAQNYAAAELWGDAAPLQKDVGLGELAARFVQTIAP